MKKFFNFLWIFISMALSLNSWANGFSKNILSCEISPPSDAGQFFQLYVNPGSWGRPGQPSFPAALIYSNKDGARDEFNAMVRKIPGNAFSVSMNDESYAASMEFSFETVSSRQNVRVFQIYEGGHYDFDMNCRFIP